MNTNPSGYCGSLNFTLQRKTGTVANQIPDDPHPHPHPGVSTEGRCSGAALTPHTHHQRSRFHGLVYFLPN